jgi:hypothetical protein
MPVVGSRAGAVKRDRHTASHLWLIALLALTLRATRRRRHLQP